MQINIVGKIFKSRNNNDLLDRCEFGNSGGDVASSPSNPQKRLSNLNKVIVNPLGRITYCAQLYFNEGFQLYHTVLTLADTITP